MPKIICANCKAIEDVDESPEAAKSILCSDCKNEALRAQRKRRKRKNIPRKQHGTRVMLPITCAECGAKDTLDYVPKGADLDDVLCRECAQKEFGTDSDWARIERAKAKEDKNREWPFECDICGRTDYLPFEPDPERTYDCNLCRMEHDTPTKDRISNRKKAAGGVFIRRPTEKEDKSDAPDNESDAPDN